MPDLLAALRLALELIAAMCRAIEQDDAEALEALRRSAVEALEQLSATDCVCELYGFAACEGCQDEAARLLEVQERGR